jgi:hypothetical protein
MTDECPKCHRRLWLVPAEIAQVGALLQCQGYHCDAVLIVTKSGPSPLEFEARLATEEEKQAAHQAAAPT